MWICDRLKQEPV